MKSHAVHAGMVHGSWSMPWSVLYAGLVLPDYCTSPFARTTLLPPPHHQFELGMVLQYDVKEGEASRQPS